MKSNNIQITYDVFLSYNSEDKGEARAFNRLLVEQIGLKTWFDDEVVIAGDSVFESIENGIQKAPICLALIGKNGQGPWQTEEIRAALRQRMQSSHFRVIPVILPSAANTNPNIPIFLREKSFIDLREDYFDGLRKLLKSIRGDLSYPLYENAQDTSSEQSIDGIGYNNDLLPAGYTAGVKSIVELLIGQSLYSRRDVCIRELIQNAVDACQRRIARQKRIYYPEIILRINTLDGWFEVDDNGEGMNPSLLKNSFAVIGKSISKEENVLSLVQEKRLYLIAKFGIGFVSTFMLSRNINISTKFENDHQINFSIYAFNERFLYRESSDCGRDPEKVGTTVRVNLLKEHTGIEVAKIAQNYIRHVPYCRIIQDGNEIQLTENWNTEYSSRKKIITSRSSNYELHLGVNPEGGTIIASNWGFLVGDNINPIIPFFTPTWVVGEIDFLPGTVDLNVARDGIVLNEKAIQLKQEMQLNIRTYLSEIFDQLIEENKIQQFRENDSTDINYKLLKQLRDYIMVCNRCHRYPDADIAQNEQIFSLELTNQMILDLFTFEFGSKEQKRLPLRDILDQLKKGGKSEIYYSWGIYDGFYTVLAKYLKNNGYLVINWQSTKVLFRGSKKGEIEANITSVLSPLFKDLGFKLLDIADANIQNFASLFVKKTTLSGKLRASLDKDNKLIVINLSDADMFFVWKDKKFFNIGHPSYIEFLNWSQKATESEIDLYIAGVLQEHPNIISSNRENI